MFDLTSVSHSTSIVCTAVVSFLQQFVCGCSFVYSSSFVTSRDHPNRLRHYIGLLLTYLLTISKAFLAEPLADFADI